jgi:hypothetical protein
VGVEGGLGTTGLAQKLAPNRALKTNLAQSLSLQKRIRQQQQQHPMSKKSTSSLLHFLPSVNARMLSSSTPRPVSRAVAQSFAHAGPSVVSFAATLPVFPPFCADDGGCSTSTTRTTAVPSNTRRILSASQGCTRGDEVEVEWDEDNGEEDEEEPEKACQNALPRRCVSVCEAIDASAACCGVGDDDDDADAEEEPSLGVEGGVGYVGVKEDVSMCLPLREAELRMAVAEEK